MKPSKIQDVLDLALRINDTGKMFNAMFVGPAGVGKSEIVQEWCNLKGLPFIDLRAAYLEAPDVNGFPSIRVVNGRQVLSYATPEYWPTEGRGVLFLDEVNRANTSVMNAFMQLLTDRKIHGYTFPQGWMVVAAINPETAENDVNTMDTAFRNRFVAFDIEFDKKSFVDYTKTKGWNKELVTFIESSLWTYSKPEDVGNKPGDQYISPRDLSKLNSILEAGFNVEDELTFYEAVLGKNYAMSFYKFRHDEAPVSYVDLLNGTKVALKKLEHFSDPDNYKNAQISVTIQNIIEEGTDITDDLLAKVILAIPADQGPVLLRDLQFKRKSSGKADPGLLDRIFTNKEVSKYLKNTLKVEKPVK